MALETESTFASSIQQDTADDNDATEAFDDDDTEQLIPGTTFVTHCIMKNDPRRFVQCFEDEADPYRETVNDLLNQRDDDGKTPLDVAAKLGRVELTKELIARGADVTATSPKGYTCLHFAAAWGRISVLKLHYEAGGDVQQRNSHGERPYETALRYNQQNCVDFLDWAEAKTMLQQLIKSVQDTILEADKAVAGRISKEEKNIALNTCKEKQEWLDQTADATTQDFTSHRLALAQITQPILVKMLEPAPEKGSAAQSRSVSRPKSSARPKSGKTTPGGTASQKNKKKK